MPIDYINIGDVTKKIGVDMVDTDKQIQYVKLMDGTEDSVTPLTFATPISIPVTPSIDAATYSIGDNLDADILTFADAAATTGGSGWVTKLVILDKDNEAKDVEVWLLNASITPPAQNAAFSLSDVDLAKVVGVIDTSVSGTWYSGGGGSVCVATLGPPIPFKLASGKSLFAVVKMLEAPTGYASTSDLVFTLHILRD